MMSKPINSNVGRESSHFYLFIAAAWAVCFEGDVAGEGSVYYALQSLALDQCRIDIMGLFRTGRHYVYYAPVHSRTVTAENPDDATGFALHHSRADEGPTLQR